MSCRVRVWDIFQTLFNGENWSHVPLASLLADFRVLVHLEVYDSSYDVIILDLMRGKIVITGPEGAQYNVSTSLLLWKLGNVVSEGQVNTVVISRHHISPDTEENVLLFSDLVVNVHACLITLRASLV